MQKYKVYLVVCYKQNFWKAATIFVEMETRDYEYLEFVDILHTEAIDEYMNSNDYEYDLTYYIGVAYWEKLHETS